MTSSAHALTLREPLIYAQRSSQFPHQMVQLLGLYLLLIANLHFPHVVFTLFLLLPFNCIFKIKLCIFSQFQNSDFAF